MRRRSRRFGVEHAWHVGVDELFSPDVSYGGRDGTVMRFRVDRWCDGNESERPIDVDEETGYRGLRLDRPGLYRIRGLDTAGMARSRPRYAVVDPRLEFRMYTLIPRVAGAISSWSRHIDHAESLGFDSIQLLPVTEMGSSRSPYSISDHFSIDSDYETGEPEKRLEAFDRFVSECAERSIRLCLDLVLNHVAVDGRVARVHPEWLAEDPEEPDGVRRAGWSDGRLWHSWRDLAKLEFLPFEESDREALYDHLDAYAMFWAERAARTDGIIRLDNLHSADQPYLRRLLRRLRREFPHLIILGELFGEERMIKRTANSTGVNLLLGTPWEHKFVPELRSYLHYIHRMHNRMSFHVPVSSHDSGTVVEEFGSHAATAPRLVTSVLLGSGSTGMVQGIEYGEEKQIRFIGPPVEYRPRQTGDFRELVTALNELHRDEAVFRRPGNVLFVDHHHVAIIAALRIDPESGKAAFLVCANFDTSASQTFTLAAKPDACVYLEDVLDGRRLRWDREPVDIELAPGGIGVFRCTDRE